MRHCKNCGTAVSVDYVRVFCPDGVESPSACPYCPDMTRDGAGRPREAKSERDAARTIRS